MRGNYLNFIHIHQPLPIKFHLIPTKLFMER